MALRQEFRHAIRIVRTELRRGWRSAVDRWTLVGVGLGLCLFAGWMLLLGGIGYLFGSFSKGETFMLTDSIGGQLVGWVLFLSGLIAIQAVENRVRIDNEELLFTTVTPRTVLLGLLGTEFARQIFFFGSFVLVVSVGFAFGVSAPTLVPITVLVSLPVLVFVVLLGHVTAVAAKTLSSRISGFGWLRTGAGLVIGALVGLAPILVVGGGETLGFSLDLASMLTVVPIAAYVDLFALGTPLEASFGLDTAVAVAIIFGSIPLLFTLDHRLARALWFSGSKGSAIGQTSARTPPARLTRGSTGWLAWWYWLRGLRAPSRFTHLLYYSFPLFWLIFDSISDPSRIPSLAAVVLPVLGVLFAGATFGLNPLGDERKALPTVLSIPDGERFVRARFFAGLPWAAVALMSIVLGGVVGRFEPGTTILLAILVASLSVFSAAIAPMVGITLPRFEPIATTKNEVITPSFGAIVGHAGAVGTAGAVGLVAVYAPTVLGSFSGSTPTFAARAGLVCAVAAVILGASLVTYRHSMTLFRAATVS